MVGGAKHWCFTAKRHRETYPNEERVVGRSPVRGTGLQPVVPYGAERPIPTRREFMKGTFKELSEAIKDAPFAARMFIPWEIKLSV